MKPLSDEFTAFIGIDWADKKHDICLQGAHGERREFSRIEHKVDAIDQWAISMRQRFGGPIAVALELTKGPLVYALQKYDFFVLFPINPATLAKYREAFKPSRAKDGPTDAEHALELLMHHRERLTALNPQSVPMRTLLHLVAFATAAEIQKYSGVAPVTERSGNKCWIHWRWQCPAFLRQTFVEWAAQTINKSFWAGAFYRQQRDKGSSHQAAVRALACKWLRILYRCWQTRTPYDESTYLNALKKRGSPLLNQLNTQT